MSRPTGPRTASSMTIPLAFGSAALLVALAACGPESDVANGKAPASPAPSQATAREPHPADAGSTSSAESDQVGAESSRARVSHGGTAVPTGPDHGLPPRTTRARELPTGTEPVSDAPAPTR